MNDKITILYKQLMNESDCRFRIRGFSMIPCFREGCIINISPVKKMSVGHCYLFRHDSRNIFHRLVKITRGGKCVFMGDNCENLENVKMEYVIGEISTDLEHGFRFKVVSMINRAVFYIVESGLFRYRIVWKLRKKLIYFLLKGYTYEKKV